MAASTALMQPVPSSSSATNSVLTSSLTAMSNGTVTNVSDSDSGNASDQDNSPGIISEAPQQTNQCSLLSSTTMQSTKRKLDSSNEDHKTIQPLDSSTEEETVDDANTQQTNIIKQTVSSSNDTTPSRPVLKNTRQSTGKLERITERLAKKQNGAMTMTFQSTSDGQSSNSKSRNDYDNSEYSQDVIDGKADCDQSDDIDEEEDEEIKNGFRALGLMGNVAFIGDESFKCPVCHLKLDSQHTFTLHIRSHNPNDHSNTCSLCGKTLSSASSLDRHMLIHSGERPFKCSLCGMAFTTNGNMHRHMRTHGHGSIGYTPRGQKRRAKLLTQALEKAMAAAAAGEHVDFEAINKLKKSILESKVTPPPPSSSTSTNSKRLQKQSAAQSNSFSEQLLSTLAPNVSIEAAAAAAVAAASNKSLPTNTHPGLGRKQQLTNKSAQQPNGSSCSTSSSTSHCPSSTINNKVITDPGLPLNLANNNNNSNTTSNANNALLRARWPHQSQPGCLAPSDSQPVEKGRPGRKKKQRLSSSINTPSSASDGQLPVTSSNNLISGGPFGPLKAPCRCPICAHPARNTTELHVHMMAYHRQEKLFCNDCGMILDNYDTYTHHHCTASAATVMTALSQNPTLRSDLLFCSSNTSRMNFSSARTFPANLEMFRSLSETGPTTAASLLTAAQLANLNQFNKLPLNDQRSCLPNTANTLSTPKVSSSKNSSAAKSISCSQCIRGSNKKFGSIKELKHHHDTFCHQCNLECDSVSTFQLHQFSHSFEKLTPQLDADKMQLLKNAAALSLLPNMANTSLISPALTTDHGEHSKHVKSPTNAAQQATSSSIASLTSMANMKPDLADIESILSIVHGASSKNDKHSTANQLRSPISPSRASDAGDLAAAQHRVQVNGGEATNQPESPASADSAAGAVAASNSLSNAEGGQHSTKTDLNGNSDSTTCSKSTTTTTSKSDKSNDSQPINLTEPKESGILKQNANGQTSEQQHCNASSIASSQMSVSPGENEQQQKRQEKDADSMSSESSGWNRFRCESCRLSFKSLNALRRHNRGHTAGGGHSHACHLCPYKSLDKSTLIRHLRTHNGERPFQCAICKYAFTTKANCERHVRKRHRNLKSKSEIRSAMQYNRDMAATAAATKLVSEKIFIERDQLPTSQDTVCKKCQIDFGSNRELRAHLRVPNNPCSQQLKPFVCMICNIGFNTRNNCVRHIIKQHPSTIEVSEEDAAKAVAEAESLMIETGSSSSLSPASDGQLSSNHSSFSSGLSDQLSDSESLVAYEDELENEPIHHHQDDSGHHQSSFAALCRVAQQVNGNSSSPLDLSKRN